MTDVNKKQDPAKKEENNIDASLKRFKKASPYTKENKNIIGSKIRIPTSGSSSSVNSDDKSIFGGQKEISRSELREKLKSSETFSAQQSVGLSLSQDQRAKLEKQALPSYLGGNISKEDVKSGIKNLNRKMIGTKDPAEKDKLRREAKFFKKIGGV